jgi:hypothetical protein
MSCNEINSDDFYAHKKAEGLKIDPSTALLTRGARKSWIPTESIMTRLGNWIA